MFNECTQLFGCLQKDRGGLINITATLSDGSDLVAEEKKGKIHHIIQQQQYFVWHLSDSLEEGHMGQSVSQKVLIDWSGSWLIDAGRLFKTFFF